MVSKKELIDFLSKDPIRNVNLIYFAENYTLNSVEFEGDSVLVKGKAIRTGFIFQVKTKVNFLLWQKGLKLRIFILQLLKIGCCLISEREDK